VGLADFARGRYRLLPAPSPVGAVHLMRALPVGGSQPGPAFLPPAARLAAGRVPSGRGLSVERAIASALGEAAQLVSCCRWGDEETVSATAASLGSVAILPNDLLCISQRQFAERDDWNAEHGDHDWLPAPFDPTIAAEWLDFRSPEGQTALLPAACTLIGWFASRDDSAYAVADTNGTAAGETMEDAIAAAFLELVERDATAIWWHGRFRRPAVDLRGTAADGELMRQLYGRARRFHVLDISADFGIPVLAAISADADGRFVAIGVSADFDPCAAALSAMTEMCQTEVSIELYRSNPKMLAGSHLERWVASVSLDSAPHLLPAGNSPPPPGPETSRDPAALSQICRRHGLGFWFRDMTRPEIGVPVARVFVPGLRHYKARHGPGRLYQVPPALGWPDCPVDESGINPVPLAV